MDDKNKIAKEILSAHEKLYNDFRELLREAELNFELIYGNHWAEFPNTKLEQAFDGVNRIRVDMPVLYPKFQTILGFQKLNRLQFEAEPQTPDDELVAELINGLFKFTENINDPKRFIYTESDCFEDALIAGWSGAELYTDKNPFDQSVVKIRRIPYWQLLFDRNMPDMDTSNCSRIQQYYNSYIEDLVVEHPDKKSELENLPEDYTQDDYSVPYETNDKYKKRVKVIRDWQSKVINVYRVYDIETGDKYEFKDKKEAEAFFFKLQFEKQTQKILEQKIKETLTAAIAEQQENLAHQQQLQSELEDESVPTQPPQTEPETAAAETFIGAPQQSQSLPEQNQETIILKVEPKLAINYTKIAGEVVLESEELEVDEHPVTLLFCIFNKGKIYSLITVARRLQQYIDRLFSQLDYNIGIDSKAGGEVNIDALYLEDESYTLSDVKEAWTKGGLIFKHGAAPAITPFPKTATNPAYFQIFELLLALCEDTFGGRNFQGSAERTAQSGRAIQKLQQQAQIMSLNIMSNLLRWKEQMGYKLLKYFKQYYTYPMVVRIIGESLTDKMKALLTQNDYYRESMTNDGVGYLFINKDDESVKKLQDTDVNVYVRLSSEKSDEKEIEFEKLLLLRQQGIPVPPEAFFDTMNLRATTKELIKNEYRRQMQQAQMQAMAQMQMQQQALQNQQELNKVKAIKESSQTFKNLTDLTLNQNE